MEVQTDVVQWRASKGAWHFDLHFYSAKEITLNGYNALLDRSPPRFAQLYIVILAAGSSVLLHEDFISFWRKQEFLLFIRAHLTVLVPLPINNHIMTGVIKDTDIKDPIEDSLMIKDAVETFLVSTWPDEERFDDWTEYRIIVIGRPDLSREIHHSVMEMVNSRL